MEGNTKETAFLLALANALAEQDAFPDLHGGEDSKDKLAAAERAVRVLREHLRGAGVNTSSRTRLVRAEQHEKALVEAQALIRKRVEEMKSRLAELATRFGAQQAGYDFQDWFYDLTALQEVISRRPYVIDGRQIDGTVTIEGDLHC